MKRKFILFILLISVTFSSVGCTVFTFNPQGEDQENNKIVKKLIVNEKGKKREIKITAEQSKKLLDEINKLLVSGTDKPFERKFSDFFKFGKMEVLFDFDDLIYREKNNAIVKETMEKDLKEHIDGGASNDVIEKKFGKEGSKIRTTATVVLDIDGKSYIVFNDEPIVDILVELLVN